MKRNCLTILYLTVLIIIGSSCKSTETDKALSGLVPRPVKVKINRGNFLLNSSSFISANLKNKELNNIAKYLKENIKFYTSLNLTIKEHQKSKNTIELALSSNKDYKKEGYELNIDTSGIKIIASDTAGLFYGVQTLIALLPAKKDKTENIKMNSLNIIDYPAYSWRGMMLDTCRHFMPVSFIKKFIDYLAIHKMNRFHWHLTEDQGWRIEIDKYPRLTEIGAWRKETLEGHYSETPHKYDGKKHGGFYSKKDIREIVQYAKERYISIIPEIEMPGHSGAAIASYPYLACTEGPFEVKTIWGIHKDVYCAGKESTFEFLEDVLSEVIELFPSEYIHIGGDECPKDRWKECPDCQARIKNEGLKDEQELQSYFIKRIENFLNSKGKKLIGWDEILEGGLAPSATVMSWRGIKGGIEAANQGHDVIMSPTSHCYFDYYQGKKENEPLAIGGYLPLKKVYSFEPMPKELKKDKRKHILGGQANLWTEYVKTPRKAEYMLFPRMAAMSEVLWTKMDKRNWDGFKIRLAKLLKRYDLLNINYSKTEY